MFTSDNFNKYPEAEGLLGAVIEEQLGLEFFVQCDTQIARQEHLVELLAEAGCFQMFVGAESFNRQTLWRPTRVRTVRRRTTTSSGCAASTESARTFPTSLVFRKTASKRSTNTCKMLREMDPTWASFYVLCPIPGTEQYDDFLAQGLITENNLDRFDTTCLTWRHPSLFARAVVGITVRLLSQVFLVAARCVTRRTT